MATLSFHVNNTKKAPHFDGTNYPYWKVKMTAHLKSINRECWVVTENKFEVARMDAPTPVEEKKLQANDIAISALHEALSDNVFEQVKNITIAHDAWKKLEESYEGDEDIKTAKAFILSEKLTSFKMKEDESVPEMFHRMESLINELKACGEVISDKHFNMKFLRCLPKRFDNMRSMLVKTTLKTSTPQQILNEVMTDDMYRDDDVKEELIAKKKKEANKDNEKDDKKGKGIALAATSSNGSNAMFENIGDEDFALFVRKFGSFMKKKGYNARRKKSSSKSHGENMKCFRCHGTDHLIAKCPYDSDDEDAIKKERKKQKKKQAKKEEKKQKKKKNEAHVASWDSDTSSSEDESSSDDEDDKKKKKKGHASVAIHHKTSLFDGPSCFMAKADKVQSDNESDHDSDSDASDSDSDIEETHTNEQLYCMFEDCKNMYLSSRKECKGLIEERNNLKQELEELKASYESLKVDHKKLGDAHTKLEKAHSSILKENEALRSLKIVEEPEEENLYVPIAIAPTNPSCSTSTTSSSSSDSSLLEENNALKEEVKELNHTLAKAYGGSDRLLMCLGSQRASLHKEGLGYIPKKGKAAFVTHKTSFVKNNGSYCKSCKQVGHVEQRCMNKKTNVSTLKLDNAYMLVKGVNGVKARFIGTPLLGSKKKAIWVPKSLVANLGGPKQCWVPKKN